ncbi:MAG: hypothetical protein R3D85_00670 [Paracoccaceae bacterium]
MTARRVSIGARRSPETEAAVLDAAAGLVAEKGLAGFTHGGGGAAGAGGQGDALSLVADARALLMAVYQRQKQIGDYPDTGTLEGDVTAILAALFAHWGRPEGRLSPYHRRRAERRRPARGAGGLSPGAAGGAGGGHRAQRRAGAS